MSWEPVKFDSSDDKALELRDNSRVTLESLLGLNDEDFLNFNLTEIQNVLSFLNRTDVYDLAHAEALQQQSLRGADILSEYLGKIIKTVGILEAKTNTLKNRVALEYTSPDGTRTTADMKKQAGESSPEVEKLLIKLAQAKGAKSLLEKKYDILIKAHHHYKDISAGLRKTIMGTQMP